MIVRVPGDLAVILSVHLTDHEALLQRMLKADGQDQECAEVREASPGMGEGTYLLQ